MIISDNEKLQIRGTSVDLLKDLSEIFFEFHTKLELEFTLTEKAPELLQKYVANINNCIKQAPEVIRLLSKE